MTKIPNIINFVKTFNGPNTWWRSSFAGGVDIDQDEIERDVQRNDWVKQDKSVKTKERQRLLKNFDAKRRRRKWLCMREKRNRVNITVVFTMIIMLLTELF